jgi:hypothetical protein
LHCRIKEYLRPLPEPPGALNRSLVDPDHWQRLHADDVKFAVRAAAREHVQEWKCEWLTAAA